MEVLTRRRALEQAGSRGLWLPGQLWVSASVDFCARVGFCHEGPQASVLRCPHPQCCLPCPGTGAAGSELQSPSGGSNAGGHQSRDVSSLGAVPRACRQPCGFLPLTPCPRLWFGPGAETAAAGQPRKAASWAFP